VNYGEELARFVHEHQACGGIQLDERTFLHRHKSGDWISSFSRCGNGEYSSHYVVLSYLAQENLLKAMQTADRKY